jgi:hypothetical protein
MKSVLLYLQIPVTIPDEVKEAIAGLSENTQKLIKSCEHYLYPVAMSDKIKAELRQLEDEFLSKLIDVGYLTSEQVEDAYIQQLLNEADELIENQ